MRDVLPLCDIGKPERRELRGLINIIEIDTEPTSDDVLRDLAKNELPLAYVDHDGKAKGIAFPAMFTPDFYFAEKNGQYLIAIDLIALAKELGEAEIDEVETSRLLTKGYCDPSRTICRRIFRFEGYSYYSLINGVPNRQPLPFENLSWENDMACYSDFKRRIDSSFDYWLDRYQGKKMHVLLSGGADSRLVFLSLLKRGIDFTAQSLTYYPVSIGDNLDDVAVAAELCRLTGVAHNVTRVDADTLQESYMVPIVEGMPCCAHSSIGFKVPIDSFAEAGSVIWTGQNMDALYNMGATQRFSLTKHGIAQLLKRFYLSEEFMRTLDGVTESSSPGAKAIAHLGLGVFRRGYHDDNMSLPVSATDYLERFKASDDYVVLRPTPPSVTTENNLASQVTAFELKQMAFKDKLGYVRGGDAQSIATSARLNGAEVVYPYATTELMQWFNSYHLTSRDTLSPKRFVYRYVAELATELDSRLGGFRVPKKQPSIIGDVPGVDLYEFCGTQLNSRLYREMQELVGGGACNSQGRARFEYLHGVIRRYWIAAFKRSLNESGLTG